MRAGFGAWIILGWTAGKNLRVLVLVGLSIALILPRFPGVSTPTARAAGGFDYGLNLNPNNATVVQGGETTTTVTAVLTGGTSQSVNFAASNVPNGVRVTFANPACNPTCSSKVTFATGTIAPPGLSTITISATPLGATTKPATFNLTVNACPAGGPYKAAVFIGDVTAGEDYAYGAGVFALKGFQNAGYLDVAYLGRNSATAANVTAVMNDPCTRALWIIGHGGTESVLNRNGKVIGEKYVEAIFMADGNLITGSSQYAGALAIPVNLNINQVVLQSCGQGGPNFWIGRFGATTTFNSWPGSVKWWTMSWWERWHSYPKIDPNTGKQQALALTANFTQPPPLLDNRLDQVLPSFPASHGLYLAPGDGSVANNCLLQGTRIGSAFGNQTFNFYSLNDTNSSQKSLLFGSTVQNGCISSTSTNPLTSSFNVTMTNSAIFSTIRNTDNFPILGSGQVFVDIPSSNPLTPGTLLAGFRQVLFGTPMLANFTYSPPSQFVANPISFTSYATGRNDTLPYTFQWDFGDGIIATCQISIVAPYGTEVGCIVSHAYSVAGFYTVKVTVTDAANNNVSPTYCDCDRTVIVSPYGGSIAVGGGGSGRFEKM